MLETLVNGPAIDLGRYRAPAYIDADGNVHARARLRWWDSSASYLRDAVRILPGATTPTHDPYPELPNVRCREIERYRYPKDER